MAADPQLTTWTNGLRSAVADKDADKAAAVLTEARTAGRADELKQSYNAGGTDLKEDLYAKISDGGLKSVLRPFYGIENPWTSAAENVYQTDLKNLH